jgi:hypothetical protein
MGHKHQLEGRNRRDSRYSCCRPVRRTLGRMDGMEPLGQDSIRLATHHRTHKLQWHHDEHLAHTRST